MPFIHLQIVPRPDVRIDEAALARTFVSLGAEALGKNAALTAVRVERILPSAWFIGGRAVADDGRAAAHVRIEVTRGTNTDAEKAEFIARSWAALRAALGELHPASYVVVDELDAGAWGYGGRTQAARRLDRTPA